MFVLLALVLIKGASNGPLFNRGPSYSPYDYPRGQYGAYATWEGTATPVLPEGWREKNQAMIVVTLPAEARLTIDGTATTSTSGLRVFASPALEPGREFRYTLKADWMRDGQKVTSTKEVVVRAGEQTNVVLEFPEAQLSRN